MIQLSIGAVALLILGGCAPDLQALAADKNAICVTETSVWVTIKLDRNWGCDYPPPGFMLVPDGSVKPVAQ